MNEVIGNILTRRSCRNFTAEGPADEDLALVLKAAEYAPTARGSQDRMLTVVLNKEKILALAAAVKKALHMPENAVYNFYGAPVIVIISNERGYGPAFQDAGAIMENTMLAAHSLGISSCWINQLCDTCDDPGVRAILDSFGIGHDRIVPAVAALGYAGSAIAKAAPRKESVSYVR